ncbi:Ral GTPase-activating protein subunit alpha-1 [Nymphon striatum]|nr:Ral GTPase-activating protein subunit alpha-1 [Nymphon striatum]
MTGKIFRQKKYCRIYCYYENNLIYFVGISPALEQEVERIISNAEEYVRQNDYIANKVRPFLVKRKSRSMDSLSNNREILPVSTDLSWGTETPNRSPSPAPSTGIDSNSFKDSPMHLDVIGSSDNSCSNSDIGIEQSSVMAGGNIRGWLPDVAVILWRRMLCALGEINLIDNPEMHSHVIKYLTDLFETMLKLRNNLGVTADNQTTPPSPELIPPITLIVPWLFQALNLDARFQKGKLYAYRLLCTLTVRQHDLPLPQNHIVQFYKVLHHGLVGHDQEVINTIVKYCGSSFFFSYLPGCTLLILDFTFAANTIASSNELNEFPRTEAIAILGSLLCFPEHFGEMSVFQPNVHEPTLMTCDDVKEHLVSVLLKSGKREPAGLSRCIAISSLGIYIYEELAHRSFHGRVREALFVLLTALRFNSHVVAQVASDMLLLLKDHVDVLLEKYPDIPVKIIEDMSSTLLLLLPNGGGVPCNSDRKLLVSMLFCIGEWCMAVPLAVLMQSDQQTLQTVFKARVNLTESNASLSKRRTIVDEFCFSDCSQELACLAGAVTGTFHPTLVQVVLHTAATGKNSASVKKNDFLSSANDLSSQDFDPNITVDNLKETSSNSSLISNDQPKRDRSVSFHSNSLLFETKSESKLLRLAASTVMYHLINHLNHFPIGLGASRLNSMVNENDDISFTGTNQEELSTDIFNSSTVQLYLLNNDTLLSFVEIPTVEIPGSSVTTGLTTSKSQVRVIIRNLSGKFSWDSTLLHYQMSGIIPNSLVVSDSTALQNPPHYSSPNTDSSTESSLNSTPKSHNSSTYGHLHQSGSSSSSTSFSPQSNALQQRLPQNIPVIEDSTEDVDNLDDLLQYVGHTSPECLITPGCDLNVPAQPLCDLNSEMEKDIIRMVLNQSNFELDYVHRHSSDQSSAVLKAKVMNSFIIIIIGGVFVDNSKNEFIRLMTSNPVMPVKNSDPLSPFQHCRALLMELGLLSWEKRQVFKPQFDLLKKNEKLLRELKNLDNQLCRETHKIAVIYVAEGQEDKNSVLRNSGGSQAYEEFISGLAWEVELENHPGFMGGLQKNRSTGDTAPYYATSLVEVVFHVATRMPTNNEDSYTKKLRHLGNDEIHIVWSEHTRDYRRGIIATEFCDVLIVIYPLPNKLFRIQLSRKAEVPYFGPLFDGAIVDQKILPGLVRATAINASKAKRSLIPLFQNFSFSTCLMNYGRVSQPFRYSGVLWVGYEERARSLETIKRNHKDPKTFEEFSSCLYNPSYKKSATHFAGNDSSSIIPPAPFLTTALIDDKTESVRNIPLRQRPISLSSAAAEKIYVRAVSKYPSLFVSDSVPTSLGRIFRRGGPL